MQHLKKYGLIIVFILVITIMVLARALCNGHFRNDAGKWASPSINQSNLITTGRLKTLTGALVVDLSDNGDFLKQYNNAINIPADSLLDNANQRKLRAHKGSIILVSDDQALSARIWMLLSQMGFTELFILNDSSNIEVLRYKFQHDTIARPET